jgi:hypothetical protein
MSYTRKQWADAFLAAIGNPNPSPQIEDFVINWTAQEGAYPGGQGTYNLLNTTQPESGSYGGGTQGNIQYFPSFAEGIKANATVLENGLYPNLLTALQSNDINALCSGSSAIQQEMATWGTGYKSWYCSNPQSIFLTQQFSGNVGTTPGTNNNTQLSSGGPCTIWGIIPVAPALCNNGGDPAQQIQAGANQALQASILGPIEAWLPGAMERVGLFIFALVLVVVGFLTVSGKV